MTAYYNEIDPAAAQWLRNLIEAGLIAPGVVDERSIEDVKPDELMGYTQCHFFAGIGVWSLALRNAGWPDNRPIWTGSCPCQPFSASGNGAGFSDERHLWPHFHWLIEQCKPAIVAGEQVASKAAEPWIDLVQADMEALDYAFGCVAFPSAGVGAPHIRDRAYWMGYTDDQGPQGYARDGGASGREREAGPAAEAGVSGGLANANGRRRRETGIVGGLSEIHRGGENQRLSPTGAGVLSGLHSDTRPGPTNGFWRDADWLGCRDGKWRPTSPLPQPLVDGSAEGLGRVCAEIVAKTEEALDATAMETKSQHSEVLRDLLLDLGQEAKHCWPAGGIPRLHEAPFLLAFLRQLSRQGWGFSECSFVSSPEALEREVRGVRNEGSAARPPHQRELERRKAGKYSDALRFLSSVLARHTQEAWSRSYEVYAESCFVLAHNAPARVGRLRAYGNAINAEQAKIFIEAVMDSMAEIAA